MKHLFIVLMASLAGFTNFGAEPGLIGHWKLRGDCRDYSGNDLHGVNHGVNLNRGEFDGVGSFIELPNAVSRKLSGGEFSICAWIHTEQEVADVFGDVFSMYNSSTRQGINLTINSTGSGYSGPGNDRQVLLRH